MLFGGPFLIDLLYPDHYAPAAALMPLLGVRILAGRFQSLSMLVLSTGNSRVMLSTAALRAVAICVSLPVCFAFFGIGGALLATALSPLAGTSLLILRAYPVLGRKVWVDIVWAAGILGVASVVYLLYAP